MPSTRAQPSISLLHRLYKDRAPTSRSWLACLVAAALALGGMGCGTTTRFAPLNPSPHQLRPKPAAAVEVYSTGLPARPYTEIGLIQGTQSSEYSFDDMPEIIAEMRAAAGRVGCDALVLNGPNSRSTPGIGNLPGEGHSVNLQGFWGTCIAYLPAHDVPPPPVVLAPPQPQPREQEEHSERPSAGQIVRPAPEREAPTSAPPAPAPQPSTAATSNALPASAPPTASTP